MMPGNAFRVADLGDGLEKALLRVNALRYAAEPAVAWTIAEEILDSVFRTSNHFAVYGTLAQRILVPVNMGDQLVAVANIYEARP